MSENKLRFPLKANNPDLATNPEMAESFEQVIKLMNSPTILKAADAMREKGYTEEATFDAVRRACGGYSFKYGTRGVFASEEEAHSKGVGLTVEKNGLYFERLPINPKADADFLREASNLDPGLGIKLSLHRYQKFTDLPRNSDKAQAEQEHFLAGMMQAQAIGPANGTVARLPRGAAQPRQGIQPTKLPSPSQETESLSQKVLTAIKKAQAEKKLPNYEHLAVGVQTYKDGKPVVAFSKDGQKIYDTIKNDLPKNLEFVGAPPTKENFPLRPYQNKDGKWVDGNVYCVEAKLSAHAGNTKQTPTAMSPSWAGSANNPHPKEITPSKSIFNQAGKTKTYHGMEPCTSCETNGGVMPHAHKLPKENKLTPLQKDEHLYPRNPAPKTTQPPLETQIRDQNHLGPIINQENNTPTNSNQNQPSIDLSSSANLAQQIALANAATSNTTQQSNGRVL